MNISKLFLIGCLGILSIDAWSQCNTDYQLSWSDEFELTEVDTDKWVPQQGGGGFGNQELEYYQSQNATVSGGLLHIKIANETVVDGSTTYNYTSAKLQTASKADFLYGKMEARIKMPDALGAWPAFWMLGSNIGDVGWPHCGEIDIMEWVARGPDAATGSIFYDGIWPNNHLSTPYNIPQGQSFITDFHTFAVEWEPNEIRYYCDGNQYATYKNSSIPVEWVFNHEFYIILNCAIGGTGGGNTINIVDPKYMEVDYVRVYTLPTTADSIIVSGPKSLMENSQNVLYTTTYFPNTTYDWLLPDGATITDGLGTNAIHVNFTAAGGKVKVTAANSCATLSDSISLNVLADTCTIMYDNFDDTINVTYQATGTLTGQFANPLQDNINSSAYVGQYERSSAETYDVLGVYDIALENALEYENSSRVFFMDMLTSAPIGTQITLQLENSALNAGAYPQGRRSAYIGHVSQQNEWHTVRFNFSQIISTNTLPDQVDHVALLFDPGHLTGDVYYIDNFRRLRASSDCASLTTAITESEKNSFSIYPNPSNGQVNLNLPEDGQLQVFNFAGALVMTQKINAGSSLINLNNYPSGVYTLVFNGQHASYAPVKLVKE
ncbi:MAG: Glucan endo,3-beta-D-glucosidase [Chitinophagaceae bacterium]|nr:Glucan endo,3-beta-D-glucosidase [Chitinophagaceae bacterium]